jgi:hypothetical protein
MKKIILLLVLLCFGCANPKKDLEYLICKDSIQYWNYEWPHYRSQFYGFTFSFNKNGKLLKYSFNKETNVRRFFGDEDFGYGNWNVTKDSILTFMGAREKIVSYSEDTIHAIKMETGEKISYIRVNKKELNIEK